MPALDTPILPDQACPVCGVPLELQPRDVMPEALCSQWELNPEELRVVNRREGDICAACGNSLRLIGFARAVISVLRERFGVDAPLFRDIPEALAKAPQPLAVWECNNLSVLHPYLAGTPGLTYTEYGSALPEVPSEDLTRLSFPDDAFDLILMTDVLEHVPDLDAAFAEMRRVLRPGGCVVLTVPVLMNRLTRKRAEPDGRGGMRLLLPPSHHGAPGTTTDDLLVVHEFGKDVVDLLQRGFSVTQYGGDELPFGANTVFVLE
jgi:SAM-dependent methyltransferase